MSPAARFLTAMARYLSGARLYESGHQVLEEMLAEVHGKLEALLEAGAEAGGAAGADEFGFEGRSDAGAGAGGEFGFGGGSDAGAGVSFSFLEDTVVHGSTRLRELPRWPWARRLSEIGIQQIEFDPGVTADELRRFLELAADRLAHGNAEPERPERPGFGRIRFGHLDLRGREPTEDEPPDEVRGERLSLAEEAGALSWIHRVAAREGKVPAAEVAALVSSLILALRSSRELVVPFLRLRETDNYTASHCINVSLLSMALAEDLGHPPAEVRTIGAAGLMHDVGKVEVPSEILKKPKGLTPEEREVIEQHPGHGCRILLASGGKLGLPAAVAYEHHMSDGGAGYPATLYDRDPLPASRLVQVCDFYDALRTRRRYRAPLPAFQVASLLEENAGSTLDAFYVEAFLKLIRRWDPSSVLSEEPRDSAEPRDSLEPRGSKGPRGPDEREGHGPAD